jgi:phosphoglycolate phosphatase-like HAD superfamily hydrolase
VRQAVQESNMPDAVIFDIDGTLIDSVDLHAQAWQDAFREFGHDIEFMKIRNQIGKGGDQLMPVFLSKAELTASGDDLDQRRSEIFKTTYLPQATAFPMVRELFERLLTDGRQVVQGIRAGTL